MSKQWVLLIFSLLLWIVPGHAASMGSVQAGSQALAKQDYSQAIEMFSQALRSKEVTPAQRVVALSGRCMAYHQQYLSGKVSQGEALAQRALADCRRVIAIQPAHGPSYRLRGMVYLSRGQPAKALADLDVALRLDPTDYRGLQGRGAAKIQLNQLPSAMADLNEAIRLNPDYPGSYYYRSQLWAMQQQPAEAAVDFNTFFQLTQGNQATYRQVEQGRMQRASKPHWRRPLQKFVAAPLPTAAPDNPPKRRNATPKSRTVPATDSMRADGLGEALSALLAEATGAMQATAASNKPAVPQGVQLCFRIASFQKSLPADRAVAQGRRLHLPVYVERAAVKKRSYHGVWVGPFGSGVAAKAAQQKMRAIGYQPGPVTLC